MRLHFRWKLFIGFYSFALVVVGLSAAFGNRTLPGSLLILAGVSAPPALWIAGRLNRPIRLLDLAMNEVARGNLDAQVPGLRTYDEFEALIGNFNRMLSGLRQLRQLQSERERLLSLSTDLICLMSEAGAFAEVNPAFTRVLGYSMEAVLARPFLDLAHPEDRAFTVSRLDQIRLEKSVPPFTNRCECADGSYRWIEWSAVPVPSKKLLFVIGRDVTVRIRMEEAERSLIETRLQLKLAREIQRSLLPSESPSIRGYDIAGVSHPADEVSGDYYDYLPMRNGRVGLVVSDATGHGIGPGLVMAVTRTLLRSLSSVEEDVRAILHRTNQTLIESTPDNCLVTLALAQFDPQDRSLRYASCGHPAGYLLDAQGEIKATLTSNAPPLGFLGEFPVQQLSDHVLAPGDILLMMTDGVLEAESPEHRQFGEQRALRVVRENLDATSAGIADALHRAAREFCRSRSTQDDFTCVVLKVGMSAVDTWRQ